MASVISLLMLAGGASVSASFSNSTRLASASIRMACFALVSKVPRAWRRRAREHRDRADAKSENGGRGRELDPSVKARGVHEYDGQSRVGYTAGHSADPSANIERSGSKINSVAGKRAPNYSAMIFAP